MLLTVPFSPSSTYFSQYTFLLRFLYIPFPTQSSIPMCFSIYPLFDTCSSIPALPYLFPFTRFSIPTSPYPLLHTRSSIPALPYPLLHTRSSIPFPLYPLLHTHFSIPAPPYPIFHTHFSIPAPPYPLLHTRSSIPAPLYPLLHTLCFILAPLYSILDNTRSSKLIIKTISFSQHVVVTCSPMFTPPYLDPLAPVSYSFLPTRSSQPASFYQILPIPFAPYMTIMMQFNDRIYRLYCNILNNMRLHDIVIYSRLIQSLT